MKALQEIVRQLKQERAQIDAALRALAPLATTGPHFRKRMQISAAGRAKIAAAQRARWAKVRAGKKK